MSTPGDDARLLLLGRSHGVLSTISVECDGYPFGSVAPYCLGRDGAPVIHISRIAQHTKNIAADARVSLTVVERGEGDVQAGARVTVIADAAFLGEADPRDSADIERYRRFVPSAASHEKAHSFRFVRLAPRRFRYIGGFGRIHWIPPGEVARESPFDDEAERRIVDHMNDDHSGALALYAERLCGVEPAAGCRMAGIDAEGIHMRLGERFLRVPFDAPVRDADGARSALVELLRRARGERDDAGTGPA